MLGRRSDIYKEEDKQTSLEDRKYREKNISLIFENIIFKFEFEPG